MFLLPDGQLRCATEVLRQWLGNRSGNARRGTGIWARLLTGAKIFYIVEPTTENLDTYQKHQLRTDNEVFLGDVYGDKCWRVGGEVDEGNTLLIPSGWIHAVYTPVDSLVFGGNYLTNLNVELQCEVNSHENRFLFESRYFYPNFETINWYAARSFTEMLRDAAESDSADDPRRVAAWRAISKEYKIMEKRMGRTSVADLTTCRIVMETPVNKKKK